MERRGDDTRPRYVVIESDDYGGVAGSALWWSGRPRPSGGPPASSGLYWSKLLASPTSRFGVLYFVSLSLCTNYGLRVLPRERLRVHRTTLQHFSFYLFFVGEDAWVGNVHTNCIYSSKKGLKSIYSSQKGLKSIYGIYSSQKGLKSIYSSQKWPKKYVFHGKIARNKANGPKSQWPEKSLQNRKKALLRGIFH
jgi:hypothetical protein